jgi:universal stress protein A
MSMDSAAVPIPPLRVHNLLVPTDFSEHADLALERAMELSRRLGSRIHLLHAYHVGMQMGFPDQVVLPPEFLETVRQAAETRLGALGARIARAGVPWEVHVSALAPITAILDTAETLPADLIVLGTRGLSGIKHVLLGSVAERTVQLAPCPVITVRGKDH